MSVLKRAPIDGPLVVTSPFGDTAGRSSPHSGVDLRAATGTYLYAPADGMVTMADGDGDDDAGGVEVVLTLDSGWRIGFAHLLTAVVRVGERVSAGDIIGATGDTGRVTGPHLHITLRDPSGRRVDPAPFLLATSSLVPLAVLALAVFGVWYASA